MPAKQKPASLSPDLVAKKGSAEPAADTATRAATVEVGEEMEGNLAPLNFRVSPAFRREFRTYAAQHDMKLNQLLRLSFENFRKKAS